MTARDGYRVAVVGATGQVGTVMLRLLRERAFPAREIVPFASARSAGRALDGGLVVQPLSDETIQGFDLAIFSAGGATSGEWAPRFVEEPPMEGLDESERNGYYFFWQFPTNTFNFMPDGFLLFTIRPVDVELTQCTFSWWMPPSKDLTHKLLQSAVVNFGHLVNMEDVEICMHAQKGMRSSVYSQGRYNADSEACLHHFHRLYSERMAPWLGGAPEANGHAAHANGNGNGHRPAAEAGA
jgi:Ring hydroxylating alpha subunit (catalytic domain)/Semialdehyde dehydrogenase, NAD binding domain